MKYIITSIVLFACSLSLMAQNQNYYKGKSVIGTEEYEYSVTDVAGRLILLKNTDNQLFDNQKWKYKNGNRVTQGLVKIGVEPRDMSDVCDVFTSVFTMEEIEKMKNEIVKGPIYYDDTERVKEIPVDKISFTFYSVVSSAGELLELQIIFPNIAIFNSIHPDKMFALEQALKEEGRVIFKIPEKTKELVDYVIGISVRVRISDL